MAEQSIVACVENALKNDNHHAFAEFFLCADKVKYASDLFKMMYRSKLAEATSANCSASNTIKNCMIYQSGYWRKSNFNEDAKDYRIVNDEKYKKIKGLYLKIKKIKKARKEGKEVKKIDIRGVKPRVLRILNKVYCQENTIKAWYNPSQEKRPGKDELVQIGLYLGWGYEIVNELLIAQGARQLYPLDIVDAVGIYYLERYKNDCLKKGIDKIRDTKAKINYYLNMEGVGVINVSKEQIGKDLCSIKKEMQQLEKEYKINDEMKSEEVMSISETQYITYYVKKQLLNTIDDEKDFDEFYESVKGIVAKKQYGYLKKTIEYMDDIEKYKKNMYHSSYIFSCNIDVNKIRNIVEASSTTPIWGQRKYRNEPNENNKIDIIDAIWDYKDIISDREEWYRGSVPALGTRYCTVKEMIMGRKEEDKKKRGSQKEKGVIYKLKNNNIKSLVKFAIATGHEDQIGEYLVKSGFREENFNERFKVRVVNEKEKWEKMDALLAYCFTYRDSLIEAWKQKCDEKSVEIDKTKLKDNFPMIELIMTVNKEIQERFDVQQKKDHLNQKVSCLIYPVLKEKDW